MVIASEVEATATNCGITHKVEAKKLATTSVLAAFDVLKPNYYLIKPFGYLSLSGP